MDRVLAENDRDNNQTAATGSQLVSTARTGGNWRKTKLTNGGHKVNQ